MKNINERCPLSVECERKKCEHKFKENECSYYIGNVRPGVEIDGMDPLPDIADLFDDEGERREIEYIDIDLIHPHPDNPRKNVGDVSELAESIKHSGIMQNLTVVPYEGEYRVIIGHRRLAASKLAELKEVPCVVVEMSEKEQLGVMLCENMQRVDLTIVEQAQGMQLMLDLGDTVPDIAEKTGLSKATVGKRIKLNTLPQDKLKEAEGRGGTLEEYLKCLEIEDEKKRAKLLDEVGSKDFNWRYNTYLDEQRYKKNKPIMLAMLKEKGVKPIKNPNDRWSSKYEQVLSKNPAKWDGEDFTTILKKTKEYFYYIGSNNDWLQVFKKAEKKKKEGPQKSKKEIEADRRRKELKKLFEKAYYLREEFAISFKDSKKYDSVIYEYLIKCIARSVFVYHSKDNNVVRKAADISDYGSEKEKFKQWVEKDKNAPVVLALFNFGDAKDNNCNTYSYGENYPQYSKNESLELIYEFLGRLGYQMSTEEQMLLDGTHELYYVEEEEE